MKKVSDVHFRVCDKGLFLPIAQRLARDARKVTYWTPHERAFPTVRDFHGDGFSDVKRVDSIWQDKESVDCWVFPDVGFSYEQQEIISQGGLVWGARDADRLETSRLAFLETLKKLDLPVVPHQVVHGISNLRELLHDEEKWIKISRYRGDMETLHWRSKGDDEHRLDALAVKLGPFREQITFYVFDNIETDNEDGCDTWCVQGEYPKLVIHGMEAKDKAYLGTWQQYDHLPEELRKINDALAPVLRDHDYRSFFSTEVRITEDGTSYFIDPTCRAGSPPSQVMTEMIGNYGEVIWNGANGILIDPEPAAKFGVQALICVTGDRREWRNLQLNPEIERWVKCPNAVHLNGMLWFPPDPEFYYSEGKEIGWLVGIGDRMGEAIRHLQSNANALPDGAHCEYTVLSDLIRQIEKAEESGMEFTDQPIPKPEIVLEKE